MSSRLQKSMEGLISVFHSYSSKEGAVNTLSKMELKALLQQELSQLITCCNDPAGIDRIMTDLDENGDQELDFQEFVVLVAALTVACNDFFEDTCKKGYQGTEP